jgi:microsomal dipeptidase-like Zn-dependent dipeptidase
MLRRHGRKLGLLSLALLAAVFAWGPGLVERRLNPLVPAGVPASAAARALHARLRIVDLHADSLLWGRDLLARSERGHVDIPRLQAGNVTLQAFTVVTKSPRGLNIERNTAEAADDITLLALIQRWPPRTWGSLRARALYQAERLRRMAERSDGRLTLVRSASDLAAFLRRRAEDPSAVAGLLGLEGAHALEGEPANVDVLADAGYRMIAPTHFFDTEMGGSAHGVAKGGLTPAGRAMVQRLEARGVLLDLAHASPATLDDALALARRPVVVSHTGVRGTCDNRRNLSDAQLRGVAATGGVVGIGYWDTAVCGGSPDAIARAVRYTVDLIGAEHVALGSDFDGSVTVPFDTAGLAQLTDALLRVGLAEAQIRQVMGESALRVLAEALPAQ